MLSVYLGQGWEEKGGAFLLMLCEQWEKRGSVCVCVCMCVRAHVREHTVLVSYA